MLKLTSCSAGSAPCGCSDAEAEKLAAARVRTNAAPASVEAGKRETSEPSHSRHVRQGKHVRAVRGLRLAAVHLSRQSSPVPTRRRRRRQLQSISPSVSSVQATSCSFHGGRKRCVARRAGRSIQLARIQLANTDGLV
jgi:hypothetical protein